MSSHTTVRRPVHLNRGARRVIPASFDASKAIKDFQEQITADTLDIDLVSLPLEATNVGLENVLITRPPKISPRTLSVAWAIFRRVTAHLQLLPETKISTVQNIIAERHLKLIAPVDEAYASVVASAAHLLSIPVRLHLHEGTPSQLPEDHGQLKHAELFSSSSSREETVEAARNEAAQTSGTIFQDFLTYSSLDDTSQWISDGYLPFLYDLDTRVEQCQPDLLIVPVGAGFLAQALISHLHRRDKSHIKVLTTEPDTAACLWKSLHGGAFTGTTPMPTIMDHLRSCTLASATWPVLKEGVYASATVSDFEAHEATTDLQRQDVLAGPSGACSLAALRSLTDTDRLSLGISEASTVLLLCTEGVQQYRTPLTVEGDDPIALAQTLVTIDSSSSTISLKPGPGERNIAQYVVAWFEHRDIETHWLEPTKGHPSVVAVARGSGNGKTLMFNGHLDTVSTETYEDEPLSGRISDGKLYGRGSADMKGGLAGAMVALANAKKSKLLGNVILTAVADEEGYSMGTSDVLNAGWSADAALVNEPTNLEILRVHKGFALMEVSIYGVAAHGSRPYLGIDAICKAGYFLVELDRFAKELEQESGDPVVGPGSIHASIIKGGEETASYPAVCTVILERRTVMGETASVVEKQMSDLLEKVAQEVQNFKYDFKLTFERPPFELPVHHPFLDLVKASVKTHLGKDVLVGGAPYWTDSALLAAMGIPTLIWGPVGYGLHAKEEWVETSSIDIVSECLLLVAKRFCN